MQPSATTPRQAPLRIFIDLEGHEYWFRREVEGLIAVMTSTPSPDAEIVGSVQAADCLLRINGCPSLKDKLRACYRLPGKTSPREFTWDMSDLPTGGLPGLYASLPTYMYDGRRHRAFPLPIQCNELVRAYDEGDAKYLYGYFGATSSGLRARMTPLLRAAHARGEALVEVRDSIWHQMFDRSGLNAKADYADNLRQLRFNLCPRGSVLAGAGSRLYETMQATRVPVLISDHITLPEGVDWESCSVRIRERDIDRIGPILRQHLDRWPEMARNARRAWEQHFSPEATLGELGRQLRALLSWQGDATLPSRLSARLRITRGLLAFKPRQYYSALQLLRQRLRKKA